MHHATHTPSTKAPSFQHHYFAKRAKGSMGKGWGKGTGWKILIASTLELTSSYKAPSLTSITG